MRLYDLLQGLGFTEYMEDVKSVYQEYKVQAAVSSIDVVDECTWLWYVEEEKREVKVRQTGEIRISTERLTLICWFVAGNSRGGIT